MAYETKVLLIALGEIVRETKDPEKIYAAIRKMANAEGVVLGPLHEDEGEAKNQA